MRYSRSRSLLVRVGGSALSLLCCCRRTTVRPLSADTGGCSESIDSAQRTALLLNLVGLATESLRYEAEVRRRTQRRWIIAFPSQLDAPMEPVWIWQMSRAGLPVQIGGISTELEATRTGMRISVWIQHTLWHRIARR